MNKSDLNAIKDVVDSALETHLASVHEDITDLRNDMDMKLASVEGKLGGFENREVDKRLWLEVRVDRLEKQRS